MPSPVVFDIIYTFIPNISTSIHYRFYSSDNDRATKYNSSYGTKFSGKIKTNNAASAKIVLYGFTS